MPKYNSAQSVKSGIPLGGIGAGKLEVLPNGTLDYFTFLNNFDRPLTDSLEFSQQGLLGFHFAVLVEKQNSKVARLLQTVKVGNYSTIENIEFEGVFPHAYLHYKDSDLGLDISLDAFSFFIPHNEKDSALPLSNFLFKFSNPTQEPIMLTLVVMARNIVGNWSVGRYNAVVNNEQFTSLDFNIKSASSFDTRAGTFSIVVPKQKDLEITYVGSFNLQKENFVFNKNNISLGAWEYVREYGKLPNIDSREVVASESVQLGGAIAIRIQINATETKEIPVHYLWSFPHSHHGHIYNTWFETIDQTISFILKKKGDLRRDNSFLYDEISKTDLPDWLKDALINNLYPYFSGAMWGKDDNYGILEASETCPLMGTLDVRFYGSIATLILFPRLEIKELRQFAQAQREDGYIPHDLGRYRFDMSSNGTTNLSWKDLNPKFILMVYRDYLWIDNRDFLESMYPICRKALDWIIATDKNKDFLPDDEGQDQTFDLWKFFGASSYVSGIFLAALLAMEKMADIMKDAQTKDLCRRYYDRGRKNFIKKLWNNRYFICYNDDKDKNEACCVSQLTGQWYAHLLGLGYIVDRQMVQCAIRQIFALNARQSEYGAINAVFPDGKIDKTCSHSQNVWIGVNYAFCSLAIYEGFINEALALAKRVWDNLVDNIRNPWNQPDMLDTETGEYIFGDHYMRNMVIWAIPLALGNTHKKAKKLIDSLRAKGSVSK
jgi:uncharacterized protein (DUF608 family)